MLQAGCREFFVALVGEGERLWETLAEVGRGGTDHASERQTGPALEASYANAGDVFPGYSSPWAGPGVPAKTIAA